MADFSSDQDYASSQSDPAALQVSCAPVVLSLTLTPSTGVVGSPVAGGVVVSGGLSVQDAGSPLDGQPIGGAAVTISIGGDLWKTVDTSSEGAFAERWDAPTSSVGEYTFTAYYAGRTATVGQTAKIFFQLRLLWTGFRRRRGMSLPVIAGRLPG